MLIGCCTDGDRCTVCVLSCRYERLPHTYGGSQGCALLPARASEQAVIARATHSAHIPVQTERLCNSAPMRSLHLCALQVGAHVYGDAGSVAERIGLAKRWGFWRVPAGAPLAHVPASRSNRSMAAVCARVRDAVNRRLPAQATRLGLPPPPTFAV